MRHLVVILATLAIAGHHGARAQDQTCENLGGSCESESATQCFNTCCYESGYCGSSTANNCEAPPNPLFTAAGIIITPSERMPNHQVSEYRVDGCFCDTTHAGMSNTVSCSQTETAHCWGIIKCNNMGGRTCTDEGKCIVRTLKHLQFCR